ncbi:MAG TPA: glycosyltransferase family 4 protein [Methylomirabilota bacterium]|jgi:glycosyltransferase involved in cell wall biosynthesis|nr:glycosyltransferase family 4 protein [Methylomirabilota bacterium]
MKISLLSPSLSNNAFGRTYILALALRRRYEVEIIGPMPTGKLWPPCEHAEFTIKPLPGSFRPGLRSFRALLGRIDGDVVYAVKPLLASYGTALLKKLTARIPVVLDIDDWQLAFTSETGWRRRLPGLRTLRNSPNSYFYLALMERLVFAADAITTVSTFLNRRFGGRGALVPHGRDVKAFDPDRVAPATLDDDRLTGRKSIVFLGTPRPQKGLEDIVTAVRGLGRTDVRIVVVGVEAGDRFMKDLVASSDGLVVPLGPVPFDELPRYLALADLVVLPQKREPRTVGQIPAKLIDAMAMARPIVATAVSDIPAILDGCGWVVEPDDARQLREAIGHALAHEDEAAEMGRRARAKCVAEYSLERMEETLARVFEPFERRPRRR